MPTPRPVQKIELSEKHLFLRVAAVILLLMLGLGTIGYALFSMLEAKKGLVTIEANNGSLADVAEEFLFQYQLGEGELSPTAEQKALTLLYGQVTRDAYMLFSERETFDGIHNMAYINCHCNEVIEVDGELYRALEQALQGGSRLLYLAPLYGLYDSVFHSSADWEAEAADPMRGEESGELTEELISYIGNQDMVELRLLGDDRVELCVAPEYQKYLRENWEEIYLDFGWTKNAFIIDYMADRISERGYTHGNLSSMDGFMRNFDENGGDYEYPVFHREGNQIRQMEPLGYRGAIAIVSLRDFPLTALERERYYIYEDGEIRVPYVDPRDGRSKAAADSLIGYAKGTGHGCAEVLTAILELYLSEDAISEEGLKHFAEQGYGYLYFQDGQIIARP